MEKIPQPKEEPGLFDTIGSFPVWMLRIIDFFTPASLIKRPPPPPPVKKNPPS
ncbi:MAG: hypothetical protein HY580_08325 [Nitrospinae bacterium]|nr:hypothetical protein [Nitrospinota bacterium]